MRRTTVRYAHGAKHARLAPAVVLASALLLSVWVAAPAGAGNAALSFASLPSAQGWVYDSDGAPESSIFSVGGDALTQNTLSGPYTFELYRRLGIVDPSLPFTLSVRARVLQTTGTEEQIQRNPFGFTFGVVGAASTVGNFMGVGLGTDRIAAWANHDSAGWPIILSTAINNTQFHDYVLEGEFGVGWELYVDGAFIASGPAQLTFPASELPNQLVLGDGTRGVGALAEVTAYSFTQTQPYNFSGFFSPVDNEPVINKMKAGAAIPVKFSLNGDQGLDIFEPSYPISKSVTCESGFPIDGIEQTVTAGSSALSYDPVLDQYTYVWKTVKGWTGCRELIVMLNDGTSHVARFSF